MLDSGARKILVPVATGEEYDGAIRYAAEQARRRACGVHVVTVLHPVYLGPPPLREFALVEGELRAAGDDVLVRAAQSLRDLLGEDLPVSTELRHGVLVPSLVELSEHAALVVLQRQHQPPLSRVATMSVTNGVAARAHAPVVAVPRHWGPGDPSDPVVVGIEDPEDLMVSEHVVRLGLDTARRERTSARLVHGWWFTDAYDDLVFGGEAGTAESGRRRTQLVAALRPLVEEYADVPVDVVVRHARPADLLVHESARAAALVLGRHHPSFPLGSHLGPITRAVLREAGCPVVVAPTGPSRDAAAA